MASSGTPPSQSLINAAFSSVFGGSGMATAVMGRSGMTTAVMGGSGIVGSGITTAAIGGSGIAGATGAIAGGVGVGSSIGYGIGHALSGPVNVVQLYHSALIPAVSIDGMNMAQQVRMGTVQVDPTCLAPEFNHDYTNINDTGETFKRGNQPYERPCGSYRIALKVKDKFGTDNLWLGMTGTDPNEWPVSYHGTARNNASNIAEEGYRLSKGKRFLYGKGIYSTPELAVAKDYATSFVHEGTSYKCIFQNRVNPKYLKVFSKADTGVGIYWLSNADKNVQESELIRPYGLCIFKAGSGCSII